MWFSWHFFRPNGLVFRSRSLHPTLSTLRRNELPWWESNWRRGTVSLRFSTGNGWKTLKVYQHHRLESNLNQPSFWSEVFQLLRLDFFWGKTILNSKHCAYPNDSPAKTNSLSIDFLSLIMFLNFLRFFRLSQRFPTKKTNPRDSKQKNVKKHHATRSLCAFDIMDSDLTDLFSQEKKAAMLENFFSKKYDAENTP